MALVVVRAASQAVAATEHTAMVIDAASNRTSRLRRNGTLPPALLRSASTAAVAEAVADSEHRLQIGRPAGYGLDLLAEVQHVDVDGAFGDVTVVPARAGQELAPGEDALR